MILHDAASAFVTLIHAALLWAQVVGAAVGFVLCVVGFAVGPLVAPAMKAATRRAAGPSWARGALQARFLTRRRLKRSSSHTAPRPLWAHSQPLDYEEAA